MSFETDTHHRINQTLAKAGLKVVMPDKWAGIDALTQVMETVASGEISALDRRAVAQALAAEMIERHQTVWRASGRVDINTRFAPSYDESNPATMTRHYGIINDNDSLFPFETLEDWRRLAEIGLAGRTECEAHVTRQCARDILPKVNSATDFVGIKRGEIVCIFTICRPCLNALHAPIAFADDDYCGPFPWYADATHNTDSEDDDLWN